MGKFEGLLRRFELDHLVVQPNGADASGNLARKVEEVLRHKQEITAAIKSALPDALRAAEGNLQKVGKQ